MRSTWVFIQIIFSELFHAKAARYYTLLEEEYFSGIKDDQFATIARFTSKQPEPKKIAPPPDMAETSLSETLRYSMVDLLLLCFLAVVLTTVAFLKFFRLDI